MGMALPQVVTEDRASGAQVIDGSLKFNSADNASLTKALSSDGNLKKWTWSGWIKRGKLSENQEFFGVDTGTSAQHLIKFDSSDRIHFYRYASSYHFRRQTTQVFRDPSAWFHLVVVYDTDNSTPADRAILYVNGVRITSYSSSTDPTSGETGYINDATYTQGIGVAPSVSTEFDGSLSNINFIDGQALDASYFGYTDGLTNTWRPKKYEGTFGTNGFYLPFDGNSPIGEDKSGKGNNWTPVNFGGSVALDNSIVSGALPILNTTPGGTQAGVGVLGSKENRYYTVTTANGSVYQFDITSGNNPSLEFIRGATYKFDYSSHTGHPLLFSTSNPDSSVSAYTNGTSIASNVISFTVPHNAPATLYYYCSAHPTGMNGAISITTDETKADPYAWKNVLALPLVGANSDVSNSVNSGSTTKTITSNGDPVASNAASNFYGGSFVFDGSGDYLSSSSSADLTFGTGNFTIECWVYQTSAASAEDGIFQISTTSGGLAATQSDTITLQTNGSVYRSYANNTSTPFSTAVITNKWVHLALVRSSTSLNLFVNGVKDATTISDSRNYSGTYLAIGGYYSTSYLWVGNISDFRVYKGVAKYTSDFVVPATSPDILPDTPSGVSGGSKLTKITDGAVAFDGTGDYLNLASSTDFGLVEGDWTVECYAYITGTNGTGRLWYLEGNASNIDGVYFSNTNMSMGTTGVWSVGDGTGGDYAQNKWIHVAVCHDSTNMRMYIDGVQALTTTDNFYNASSKKLTLMSTNNGSYSGLGEGFISNFRVVKGTALYTSNFTPPTAPLTNVTNTKLLCCQSQTSVHITAVIPGTFSNDGTTWSSTVSGAVAGSPYDATKMFDGNLATYTDHNAQNSTITWTRTLTSVTSLRVYIHQGNSTGTVTTVGGNGTQVDTISTDFGPGWHNITLGTTGSTINSIAFTRGGSGNPLSIHAVEVNGTALIDGFIGKPVLKSGDSAATTFNPFTTDINAVRGQETGYATMNPLDNGGLTLANGNLDVTMSTSAWRNCRATTGMTSGKWYFEVECKAATSGQGLMPGILNAAGSITTTVGANSGGYAYNAAAGQKYNNNSGSSYGASFDNGDTISVAYDGDNGTITFYKNGVSQGVAFTSIPSDTYFPAVAMTGTMSASINFGQKPFKFPPPDGFQPLNGANVRPETVITRPDQFVGTTLYSGNNGTTQVTTGFQPDFVWLKGRSETLTHRLVDSVRGDYQLKSNTTDAQSAWTMVDILSNGFTVTNDGNEQNKSGTTYVSWAWKAGGNKGNFNVDDVGYENASDVGLTGGTITPIAASVGTKQGFSIIKWTGNRAASTVSHGLNSAVKFYFVKNLDQSSDWITWHTGLSGGGQGYIRLNTDGSAGTASTPWNSTIPTNTVFSLGADSETNGDGDEMIVYLWADVPGLQKFGKYTGNNDSDAADGPFVELGFRPGLVAIKRSNGTGNWVVYDNKRDTFNPLDGRLKWNTSGANVDNSGYNIDFLSNGFKITGGNNDNYNAASDYIYCAWAEAPTFNLYGGQSNAR